jgi:hypothetical protein
MESEPEIFKNASDACGDLDTTVPHAKSSDNIDMHRHTTSTPRPEASGYNRNLHTAPVPRASSASQTPTSKIGPSATSTPNPATQQAANPSETAADPVNNLADLQPRGPQPDLPSTAAKPISAGSTPATAHPDPGGLRHSRLHQSLLDRFPTDTANQLPPTATNGSINVSHADATSSTDLPPGQRTPPSQGIDQRRYIPAGDYDLDRRLGSTINTPDIFDSRQGDSWHSPDRLPSFPSDRLPRYEFYDRHQLPRLSPTERTNIMVTAIEGLQQHYGALVDRLSEQHPPQRSTPDRSRSLSPKRRPQSITSTDVSDMVHHMLDTFTDTQKQLLSSLHADFKKVMVQTTSQLTADFLTHLDRITTRTDAMDHSWAHFKHMQAAADKRADQQILYIKKDHKDNAKQIEMLQQENAAIIHDLNTVHDHQTDQLKQYVKQSIHDMEKLLTERQQQAIRQLCHEIGHQPQGSPGHTQPHSSHGTVQNGVYTPSRRLAHASCVSHTRDTSPSGAAQIQEPPTATHQATSHAADSRYARQTTSGINQHLPPASTADYPPMRTAADPAYALCGKLADLIEKMTDRPKSTRRDAPKVSAPTFNGAQDASFETWRSSLEDTFTYLQWPSDDPQRLALLPTVLQDYAKVHYNSMPQADKVTYETAMSNLAKAFSIAHQPPTTRAARLQRPQGPTESVRDFNLEISRRLQECNITDADRQLDIYVQNLRADVSQRVLLMLPTTLRQAQICAETVEHSLAITHRTTVLAINQPPPQDRRDTNRYRSNSRGYRDSNNRSRYDNHNQRNYRSQSRDRRPQSQQSRERRQRSSSYDNRRGPSRDRFNSRPRQRSNSDQRGNRYPRSPSFNKNRYDRSPTPHVNAIQDGEQATKN